MATAGGLPGIGRALWRWGALAILGVTAAVIAVVLVNQPERAVSAGAGSGNATVADAYALEVAASVLEGDTSGMAAGDGEGSSGGQRVWYRWRPAEDAIASFAGAAYVLYEGGAAAPTAVQVYAGAVDATGLGSLEEVPATATDAAAGSYEFLLPSLQPGETFYIGVETSSPGGFLLTVWQPTPGGPANDDLGSAESLELAVNAHLGESGFELAVGTTTYATFEIDEDLEVAPEPNASAGGGSVWYTWVVPQDGARLEVSLASGDVALHAFERPALAADPAMVDGIEAPIGGEPGEAEAPNTIDETGGSQFDPDRLVALPDATPLVLTGSLGDRFAIQVVGSDDFVLAGAVSGIDPPDVSPPVVACANDAFPTGGPAWARTWVGDTESPVRIECTVEDDRGLRLPAGSGLEDPDAPELVTPEWYEVVSETQAIVTLTASLPPGAASDAVAPDRIRQVCDRSSNCVSIGLDVTVQIDNAPPALACEPDASGWRYGEDEPGAAVDRIACTATDTGSGLQDAGDASFELVAALDVSAGPAESPAVPYTTRAPVCDAAGNCADVPAPAAAMLDRKPPTVECQALVVPPSGWFRDDATVECAVSDAGAGLASAAQSTMTITTSVAPGLVDPAATSAPLQVCDAVGNCADLPRIEEARIDRAAPVVACEPLAPWTRGTAVEVRCTAADQPDGSGLAEPSAAASFAIPLTIEPGTEVSGLAPEAHEICDVAGNCAALPGLAGVGLDDRAPVVTCAAAPTGWLRGDATVACTAVDGGSGLADPAHAAFDLRTAFGGAASTLVPFELSPAEVCDAVGNCATVPEPAGVRIDRVEPVVTCVKPVDGAYDFNVTVSCTASDADSGLAGGSLDFLLRTSVAPGTAATGVSTNSREVCDLAGNCVTFGPYGDYDIDLTSAPSAPAPTIDAPGAVNVVAAVRASGFAGIRVPFDAPSVESEIGAALDCVPDPSGIYRLGETEVGCTARDAADRVVEEAFPVRVSLAPDLAAAGPIPLDAPVPIAGRGFAGAVDVEVGGVRIATLTPSGGTVTGEILLPETAGTGSHTVVLRGVGSDGEPLLVIKPITVTSPTGPSVQPPGPQPGAPGGGHEPGGAAGEVPGVGAAGPESPGARAHDVEKGFVLDPEQWPSERFEDGGEVRIDEAADGAPGGFDPLHWWVIVISAIGLVVVSGAVAFTVRRRGSA